MHDKNTVAAEDTLQLGALTASDAELDATKLDLSSLADADKAPKRPSLPSGNPDESPYQSAVRMIESGELEPEEGVGLLKKAAEEGCTHSWIYLGGLYGEEKSALYNPALAFECFEKASQLNSGEGYYNLGLCYNAGIGCNPSEESAYFCFQKGAELQDTDCICALGICREFGIGCPINYEIAVGLYRQAAEADCATAINNLGGCYYYGHGVAQDKSRAIELYRRAAELGSASAECRLGICEEIGDGCDRDRPSAFLHYQSAAEKGNATALYRLALSYDKGIGTEQNFAKAFSCYERAARAGHALSMYEAGIMSKLGRGTKKDYTVAYKMFSAAASAGISYADYEIGNCLFNGLGTVRNREQAYSHYLSAFRAGESNPKAAFMLGLCCLKGLGTELNEADAYEWFRKGAELGSRGAIYMKGECLFFGVGTAEDKAAAVECYRRAISYEYDSAERITPPILALAQCYEKGLGVVKKPEEAMELYRKAAEFGDPDAWCLMGHATLAGVGVRAEYPAARNCFLRAARKENIIAMKMMGWFADEGKGIPVNKKDACKWYTMVINKKIDSHPSLFDFPNRHRERVQNEMSAKLEAQYRLGILLPRIGGNFDDYTKGFEYVAQAASLDYAPAQTEVAKIYVHGGDLKSYYESAFSNLDAPFEDGSSTPDKATLSNAMNKLGDAMFDGSGIVRKNPVSAARCYKISAELGCVDACYSYGWCLRHGQGVRENNAEAVKWLKRAADKGNANAAFSYGLCCEEGSGLDMKNKREALSYYRKAAASGHTEAMERYIKLSEQEN